MTISNKESVTIVYFGEINRQGYERITKVCENLPSDHPKNVDLVLSTYGGDPDAGFRIARCLQHYFEEGISLYVPHYCKSAGTLIAIGAKELVISDTGELGPLDVQLAKSDELFERSSGMDITQGFNVLSQQASSMFNNIVISIKTQTRLSTKLVTEAASQITVGTFAPIYAQIDPLRLGGIQRATEIAFRYGDILKEKFLNLNTTGVYQLVAGYPSHSFVIDRKEAKKIFERVRPPDADEFKLLKRIDLSIRDMVDTQDVFCTALDLQDFLNEEEENEQPSKSDEQNLDTEQLSNNDALSTPTGSERSSTEDNS